MNQRPPEDPVLSAHEVAAELRRTYPIVCCYLRSGALAGVKRGGRWYVRRSALDAFLSPERATA